MYGGKGKFPVFLADWNLEVVLVEMKGYPPYYIFRYFTYHSVIWNAVLYIVLNQINMSPLLELL